MARKMSRVFSAGRYAGALDAYIDYLRNMDRRGTRVGTMGNRPPRIDLFARPFAIPLPAAIRVETGTSEPAWDKLKTAVGARTKVELASGETGIKLPSYKFPRVSMRTNIAAQGTAKTSARTKMKYLDYGGKTYTAPFGRTADADTIVGVFEDLRNTLNPSNSTAIRVYLIPEVA